MIVVQRDDEGKLSELFCAVLCMTVVHSDIHMVAVLTVDCLSRFSLDLGLLFACLCRCVAMLFAFVVLGLVSSALSQEIGWEERLRTDLF